jgi:hypothetical protein
MERDRSDRFLALSAELTAFGVVELVGTGESDAYLGTVDGIVGAPAVDALLDAYDAISGLAGPSRDQQLRRTILGDGFLGPIARNLIKLWYVGIWYQLPAAWREANGARAGDTTFTVSANAYTQGLLWPAVGANPPGARAPGWASWTAAPRLAEL